MLFEKDEDLELQPKRTKTVMISLGIHVLVLIFLVLNPDLLTSPPKRIIKVMGEDYDLSKENLTELVVPPEARPRPAAPDKPLVQPSPPKPEQQPPPQQQAQQQPPPQQQQQAPPPPPPPPPPKPQAPPPVIGPDDIIKEGARPDAPPNRASRGDTTEQARAGAGGQQQPQQQPLPPRPEPSKAQQAQSEKPLPQIAQNTNPNAMRLPGGNIMDSARKTVQEQMEEERRRIGGGPTQGPRTGLPAGQEDPNFSTEEPTILSDTRGYDFGPYMNQVVNRVRANWYASIPEIARLGKRGKVVLIFTITKNGNIANLRVAANSGSQPLDNAAVAGIQLSNPFSQLPNNFDGDHLDLQFTFLYNIR
jgi:TonB family protein